MSSRARLVMVQVLVAAAAAVGTVTAAQPASAALPPGGCWVYEPEAPPAPTIPPAPPAEPVLDPDGRPSLVDVPQADESVALEPWPTDPAGTYSLITSGATAAGRTRAFRLEMPAGPVLHTGQLERDGTATVHLSLDAVAGVAGASAVALPAVEVELENLVGGDPAPALVATGEFTVPAAGAHRLRLRGVVYDLPEEALAPARRIACNGQILGEPTGTGLPLDAEGQPVYGRNPATAPVDTDLTAEFTSVAASEGGVSAVDKQAVTTAARPGDRLEFSVSGFGSQAPVTAALCPALGACAPPVSVTAGADGSGAGALTVPRDLATGAAALSFSEPAPTAADPAATAVRATVPITILGAPTVSVEEEAGSEETVVQVAGTGWDPARDVTLRGHVRRSATSPRSGDDNVVVRAGADGSLAGEFVVTDERTRTMSATQLRSDGSRLQVRVDLEGLVAEEPPADEEPPPTTTPTSDTTLPPASTTVVVPPVSIPLPGQLPINTVVDPLPGAEAPQASAPVLTVGEARLEGSPSLGEMFGGSPERTLVFELTNAGAEPVTDPPVAASIGRSTELQPSPVDAEVGTVEPGESVEVSIPIALPAASFGTYQVVGQVGDDPASTFRVEWISYPYGLFVLNLLGAALLAVGVRRRIASRPSPRLLPAPVLAAASVPPLSSEAVVDLARLESWWQIKDKGVRPPATPVLPALAAQIPALGRARSAGPAEDAVVDLDAADLWWRRQIDTSGTALDDAIVDLDAAEKWWSESRGGASARA